MTGERGNIPPPAMEYMRAAGLAHLLAISGLHIGLVTGILFFSLRALLVLIPGAALNHPIKKWAAGAALLGAGAYLLLTGATVPTQRAFLMTGLVLTAVMVDRAAISMRLVAWAAVVVLAVAPDSLMGPSFQMSFAAVVALIAVYESARHPLVILRGHGGISRRIMIYGAGVLLTTLVAGMATAPFALYHFNRFASFGLIANLGAVPVTAFWIMPWAVVAYILTPFGLEHLALVPMGWGVDGVLAIARFVSTRPGASIWVSAMPPWGIASVAIGGLWLCLWRGRWRLAGPVVILVGMVSLAVYQPPDVLVAGNGKSFAVYDGSGELLFGGEKGSKFQREIWLRRSGNGERLALAKTRPKNKRGKNKRHNHQRTDTVRALKCDALGCVFQVRGREISLIYSPAAASEDCPRSDVVVSLQPLGRTKCRGPVRVIDRFDLWREGAHAIWIDEAGMVRVETVAAMRGARPWVQKPKRRTRKAPKK
jgi:competence protein ComEC